MSVLVNGVEVGAPIECSLDWPHPDRNHAIEWAVDPDDLVLAELDDELDG